MLVSDHQPIGVDLLRVGVSQQAQAEMGNAMRVLEVENLGWEAAIVTIAGETLLLMDVALDCDDRISVMNRAMAQAAT